MKKQQNFQIKDFLKKALDGDGVHPAYVKIQKYARSSKRGGRFSKIKKHFLSQGQKIPRGFWQKVWREAIFK